MPLDPAVGEQLTMLTITSAQHSSKLTDALDRNLTQGLGVVNTSLIQQHGSTADDAATMAALRTAIHIPQADK